MCRSLSQSLNPGEALVPASQNGSTPTVFSKTGGQNETANDSGDLQDAIGVPLAFVKGPDGKYYIHFDECKKHLDNALKMVMNEFQKNGERERSKLAEKWIRNGEVKSKNWKEDAVAALMLLGATNGLELLQGIRESGQNIETTDPVQALQTLFKSNLLSEWQITTPMLELIKVFFSEHLQAVLRTCNGSLTLPDRTSKTLLEIQSLKTLT